MRNTREVVVILISVLGLALTVAVVLVLRAVTGCWLEARMIQAGNDGRQIYCTALDKVMGDPLEWYVPKGLLGYPRSEGPYGATSSTAYLRGLVTNEAMRVDFSYFALPGLASCESSNPTDFQAENNAWCVVVDLDESCPPETPFLFTRNLEIDRLGQDAVAAWSDNPPFGRRGVVVICRDGSMNTIRKEEELAALFGDLSVTNRVLRP